MSPSDTDRASTEPLRITLDFTRAGQAGDPFAFQFGRQEYIYRRSDDGVHKAILNWDDALVDDLSTHADGHSSIATEQRLGQRLRKMLRGTDWQAHHRDIKAASIAGQQRPVHVIIQSNAAELYRLPWELLALDTDQHIGELDNVLVRYTWSGHRVATLPPAAVPGTPGGRILLAWSDASGAVPDDAHRQVLAGLPAHGWAGFDAKRDEVAQVSYASLRSALEAAGTDGAAPISVLHILCHGVSNGQSVGLGFHGKDGACEILRGDQLRQLLAPYGHQLRLVVLSACDSGSMGDFDNQLGSVAQNLHRAGIERVIASRMPLSVDGSTQFAETFYPALMQEGSSVEQAFLRARRALMPSTDWMSLQLYAHPQSGDYCHPLHPVETAADEDRDDARAGDVTDESVPVTEAPERSIQQKASANLGPGLRWLHLSDLHAGGPGAAQRHGLFDKLQADIQAMADEVGPPDVILFTGDLAYRGQAEEYAEVDRVLERIHGWLAEVNPKAPAPLLFAVPGNHDVTRPQKRRELRDCMLLSTYENGDDKMVQDLRQQLWEEKDPELIEPLFTTFTEWQEKHVIAPLLQARDRDDRCQQVHPSFFPGDLSAIIEAHGVRVALVGLNSTWLQYQDGNCRGQLHIPLEQFHAALPCDVPGDFFKGCDAALLLQHHPREWLSLQGRKVFDRDIYPAERFAVCLFGHLHNARSEMWSFSGSKPRHFYQASSLFGLEHYGTSQESRAFGYAWGEVFKDGSLRIWPRKVVPRGDGTEKFDRDQGFDCPAGQEYFWLREPTKPPEPTGAGTTQVPNEPSHEADCSHLLPRYAAWAREKYRHLPMLGLGGGEFELGIDEVYVALKLAPKERLHERDKHAHFAALAHEEIEVEQVLTVAGGERHAFIRGEPGTGKTTALKKLLWTILDGDGFASERLGLPTDTVPIFLRLRHVAGPRLDIERRNFGEVLEEELAEAEVPGFGRWLWKRGGLLLLFDGLDEVGDRHARKYACCSLEKLAEQAYERNIRVVVSSRFSGIEDSSGGEVNLGDDYFVHLNVQKMRDEQIEQLIGRWYEAAGRARARMRQEDEAAGQVKGQRQGAELYTKLLKKKSAKIKELISTPMLLTLLCLMVERGGKIPERRVDFFSRCLDILLESWMEEWQRERLLDQTQALKLLEPIAWEMHCGNREYEMRNEEMRAIWAPRLRELANQRVRGSDDKPVTFEKVLDWFCSASGVLVEYGKEEYGFMHLSLQEYLAAAYAAHEAKRDELAKKFADKRWREVLLLYVGLREQRTLGLLLEQVISKDSEQDWEKERALVEECLREASERDLGPLRRLAADGRRRASERALALQMAQKYPEEALIKLASELALDKTAGAEEVRRVAEEIEMRAPWIDSVEDEEEQAPDVDVLLVGGQRAQRMVQAWAKRMQSWGWEAESRSELKAMKEPWREYRMMVIWCGKDGSSVWQELDSRRTLVEAVRRRMPMVLWMEGEGEGQVPAFLRTMSKVRETELGAKVAEMLGKEAPVGEVARSIELGEPQRGQVHEVEATGTRLLWLPGGRYWMGSGEEDEMADEDEKPRREVSVEGFWLGEMVVTNQEYGELMEKYGLSEPGEWRDRNYNQPEQPVVGVSWHDAVKYCNALSELEGREVCYRIEGEQVDWQSSEGYRLPTEAEWEYACRAGTETRWWFGDEESELVKYAWYDANSENKLQPVGRKPANPWGLYDMHGNVYEWCWDAHDQHEFHEMNVARVVRGGAFVYPARLLRSALRLRNVPVLRFRDVGFRVARGGPRALFT